MIGQVQVAIANLPVNLICISNGTLAFVRTCEFKTLFENSPDGATFYADSFEIAGKAYSYNTVYDYKQEPEMLEWLIAQKLSLPVFQPF